MYKRPQLRNRSGPGGNGIGLPTSHPLLKSDEHVIAWSPSVVPIARWEEYLRLQRVNGATEQELAHLESLHKRPVRQYTVPTKPVSYNTRPVLVKFKYSEGGVKLIVKENKLATMLREYCSIGKIPPQKIWIEAWIQAGKSFQDVLAGIVRRKSHKGAELPACLSFTPKEAAASTRVKKVLKPVVKIS
jgi:hypothetical protein